MRTFVLYSRRCADLLDQTLILDGPALPFVGPIGHFEEYKTYINFATNETSCKQFTVHRVTYSGRIWNFIGSAQEYKDTQGGSPLAQFDSVYFAISPRSYLSQC